MSRRYARPRTCPSGCERPKDRLNARSSPRRPRAFPAIIAGCTHSSRTVRQCCVWPQSLLAARPTRALQPSRQLMSVAQRPKLASPTSASTTRPGLRSGGRLAAARSTTAASLAARRSALKYGLLETAQMRERRDRKLAGVRPMWSARVSESVKAVGAYLLRRNSGHTPGFTRASWAILYDQVAIVFIKGSRYCDQPFGRASRD